MTCNSCEIRNQGNREAPLAAHHFILPRRSPVSPAQGKLMSTKSRVMAALIVLLARLVAARRAEAVKPV